MATSRLLLLRISPSNAILTNSSMLSRPRTLMCLNKVGLSSDNPPGGGKAVAAKAAGTCLLVAEPKTDRGVDLGMLLAYVADAMYHWRKFITKRRPWGFHIQMSLEKGILDCRFFTLLAIAGSLLSSVLCFVEGCFLVVASYFHSVSRVSEQGRVVFQLLEAIDMFLMGTAMLVFAMAVHVMFVGLKPKSPHDSASKNIDVKKVPSWIGMESAMQAKSKMGHALIMILQIQVLDKFKSIGVSNGIDLACFAGAIFLSSASIFLLSTISPSKTKQII